MTLSITRSGPLNIQIQLPTDKYGKFMMVLGDSQYLHLTLEEFGELQDAMQDAYRTLTEK
jgi:hypothetical protein